MADYGLSEELYNAIDIVVKEKQAIRFIRESNKIEGIDREPLQKEITEFDRFINLKKVRVSDLQKFVEVYQPGTVLRDKVGLNVRVGCYYPPLGSPDIKDALVGLLKEAETHSAYEIHCEFEALHPFTDCNGRAGRMLWLLQMGHAPLGFLHTFYYQSLAKNNP